MFDFFNFEWLIAHFMEAVISYLLDKIVHMINIFLCNHTNLFKKNILYLTFEAF